MARSTDTGARGTDGSPVAGGGASARLSRRRLLRLGAGLAGAAAGAAVLSGCGDLLEGSDSSSTPTRSLSPGTRMQVRQRHRLPEPSAAQLRMGGILASGSALLPVEQLLIYSRLVGFDPRQPVVYTDLARQIEFVDALTLRMTLDPTARFHPNADGDREPVDSAAVAAEIERRQADQHFLFTQVVGSIETPTADTLVIGLRAPFALLFELLARADASVRAEDAYEGMEVARGSGPFVPMQVEPEGRVFMRHATWHGGQPALGAVSTRLAISHPELDSAFLRNELDVRVHPNAESRDSVAVREDAVRVARASHRQRGLGLSLLGHKDGRSVHWVPAFQDARVRQAVSLALHRQALLELDGASLSGPIGPAHAGDALPPMELQAHALLQHDPAEARALLAAAGAEELEFRVRHLDSAGILPLVRLINDQLREAGFAPRSTGMDEAGWERAFPRGDFEACVFELEAMETPDIGLRLHTSEGLNGRFSLWGHSNPVYDAAVMEALSAIDPEERAERAREAQRLLLDGVPAMFPIAAPREYASMAPTVRGWDFGAYDFNAAYLSATWFVKDELPADDHADLEG